MLRSMSPLGKQIQIGLQTEIEEKDQRPLSRGTEGPDLLVHTIVGHPGVVGVSSFSTSRDLVEQKHI